MEQVEIKSKIFQKIAFEGERNRMLGWTADGVILSVSPVSPEEYDAVVSADDEQKDAVLSGVLRSHKMDPVLVAPYNPMLMAFPQEVQSYLEHNFKYHAPNELQQKVYEAIRAKAKELAAVIMANAPESEERKFALHYLKQAVMCTNQAVALNPLEYDLAKKKETIQKIMEARAAQEATKAPQAPEPIAEEPEPPAAIFNKPKKAKGKK